ncbi:MAG: OadG family protein [Bacteroidales bacterium]|nr:OadG family protein [Bacteroidales bacterium]
MMKSIKSLVVLGLLLVSLGAAAQQQSAMRINELIVTNTEDLQDEFGEHGQWVELFNSSYGTVDISGCYLTNDPNNLKKYMFPKGDLITKIKPRQFVIIWADDNQHKGTLYTNFTLTPGEELLFVGGDGKTIIDRVTVPGNLEENQSYARKTDGNGEWHVATSTTPRAANVTHTEETKSQKMARIDPYGWIMALTAMSVVFSALVILYLIFKQIGKASIKRSRKKTASSNAPEAVKAAVAASEEATGGETYAAIAMALHLFREENDTHDEESFVVTLNHTDRTYSPWSSKIYSLRQLPQINRK